MRCWHRNMVLLLVLCLLLAGSLPAFAVTQRVVTVGARETYTLGETLQLEARLLPPEDGAVWEWRCRMPGAAEETVVGREAKLMLPLTAEHQGAVLCPVAILPDGTVVRGTEKVLVVAVWYSGLELGTPPNKTEYGPGEAFDPAGVQIFALRGDGTREDVTARCAFEPAKMELGVTEVLAVCTLRMENGEEAALGCRIPVSVTAPAADPEGADDPDDVDKPGNADKPGNTDKHGNEGIKGKYGNGDTRKEKLKKLGFSDAEVKKIQSLVNKKLKEVKK